MLVACLENKLRLEYSEQISTVYWIRFFIVTLTPLLNQFLVLDIICNISESLFDINLKSLTMNWKSYTGIVQKYSDSIKDNINLKFPVQYLTNEIYSSLKCFEEMVSTE